MIISSDDSHILEKCLKVAIQNQKLFGGSIADQFELEWQKQGIGKYLNTEKKLEFLNQSIGMNWEAEKEETPDADALRIISFEIAREQDLIPLRFTEEGIKIACLDPCDYSLFSDLRALTGIKISAQPIELEILEKTIDRNYRKGQEQVAPGNGSPALNKSKEIKTRSLDIKLSSKLNQKEENPIVSMVREIILDAVRMGSSDIHFEPFERDMQVRLRQDGVLRVHRTIHARNKAEITSRIKIMANMDIAEKRRPQDGRIRVEGGSGYVDLRVSTLPTDHGEKVVLRLLDKSSVPLDINSLGMTLKALSDLKIALKQSYGLILMTGPTGAGKTTTLYACLNHIKSTDVNIVTVEDPIEYKIDGIIQTAVKAEVDYTFANALRTILRQDPNVILVGEIRDKETAEIAIRAALTGHLVLSTLHSNDAPSAVTRLIDMGIEPFLISSAITLIGAQRLVRKICGYCAETVPKVEDIEREDFQFQSEKSTVQLPLIKRGKGCSFCGRTGYSGRVGLYEILPITDIMRTMINERKDAQTLRNAAIREGLVVMREDGMIKAQAGITTAEEVFRETV